MQWGLLWTRQWIFESHKSRRISSRVKHYQLFKNESGAQSYMSIWGSNSAVLLEVGPAVYLFFVVRQDDPEKTSNMKRQL
jgi:hypothetical protein